MHERESFVKENFHIRLPNFFFEATQETFPFELCCKDSETKNESWTCWDWGEKSQKSKETVIVEFKLGGSVVSKVVCSSHYETGENLRWGCPSLEKYI